MILNKTYNYLIYTTFTFVLHCLWPGLLLQGDNVVQLVVLCADKPTHALMKRVALELPVQLKVVSEEHKYSISMSPEDGAVLVSDGTITVKVSLTSPLLRDSSQGICPSATVHVHVPVVIRSSRSFLHPCVVSLRQRVLPTPPLISCVLNKIKILSIFLSGYVTLFMSHFSFKSNVKFWQHQDPTLDEKRFAAALS